jgi:hypothetical protein
MFNIFKRIVGFVLPQNIKSIILLRWAIIQQKKKIKQEFRGTRVSYGPKNADVTFYLIRRRPPGAGMMSNYLFVLGHIKIALKRDMIPIVDMWNYENFYKEEQAINNTHNSWEYYFAQPNNGYKLNDVYSSRNVVLSSLEFPHHEVGYSIDDCTKLSHIESYFKIIRSYMSVNSITRDIIERHKKTIGFCSENILGVSVRGTDYSRLRPAGHAIQPSVDEVIQSVRAVSKSWNFEKIFLCTEEEEVVVRFNLAFPGMVLVIQRNRVSAAARGEHTDFRPGQFISAVRFDRALDKYLTGLEYLVEIFLLAECSFLLCAMTSGTAAAIYINGGKYVDKKIIDLGLYPTEIE